MKKLVIFLFFLSSLIFFSSAIFAQSCSIIAKTDSAYDANKVLMGVSGLTNAHGELSTQTNYGYVIQCDFAGSTSCDGSNKVLRLSADTNAHAEVPSGTVYTTTDICYGDLSCVSTTTGSCPVENPIEVLSLSEATNAHIGAFGDYGTKICCSSTSEGSGGAAGAATAIWTNGGEVAFSSVIIVPGTTKVKLLLKSYDVFDGTQVTFKIREQDNTYLTDDDIKSITAQVDANKRASATWLITQSDLNLASSGEEEVGLIFYFEARDAENNLIITSGDLEIDGVLGQESCQDVLICGDYFQEDYCMSDICSTIEDSVPLSTDCTEELTSCFCAWDSEESACDAVVENFVFEDGILQSLGQCVIKANKDSDPNGCADGSITYTWDATWNGDPLKRPISCTPTGGYTLSCPAEVQLPFFGFYNFIIALAFVMAIYLIANLKSKRRLHHKRK